MTQERGDIGMTMCNPEKRAFFYLLDEIFKVFHILTDNNFLKHG